MLKTIMRENDTFATLEGIAEITEMDAANEKAWCVEYDEDEQKIDEGWLTPHDIAKRMKEVDGKNHDVRFE